MNINNGTAIKMASNNQSEYRVNDINKRIKDIDKELEILKKSFAIFIKQQRKKSK